MGKHNQAKGLITDPISITWPLTMRVKILHPIRNGLKSRGLEQHPMVHMMQEIHPKSVSY
ncbi:hypothetical protein EGK68_11095 [Enterobacter cloacae]|uniref:Uncharacterized protein n=1 Tax=Enterobacter cloacae TaxID=550 RepID=A0A3R8ZED4_ENTCL|nr:hypothetical protein EGK68_11095 [Enterobacter cloacae]